MADKFFGDRPKVDDLEGAQNARYTHAKALYRHILEDLPHDGFTLQDIRDAFNAGTRVGQGSKEEQKEQTPTMVVDFGQADLDLLAELGLIEFIAEDKTYRLLREDDSFAYSKDAIESDKEADEDTASYMDYKREHQE